MKQIPKWSSLAAIAALTALATMGINARPALARADQYSQNCGGSCDSRGGYSQQDYSSGRGGYDDRSYGGRRDDRGCRNDYRDSRQRRSYHGSWQSWNRGPQSQGRRWRNRNDGYDRRGDQRWNNGGSDQTRRDDPRNDPRWNDDGQDQGRRGSY